MANIKSSIKDIITSAKKTERNRAATSGLKTAVRKAEKAIAAKDPAAKEAVAASQSALDVAAKKKLVHPNTAARKKSRIARKLNAAK
ncbi:30S ribosomal protein S20 [Dehalogenimonas etheniformans]|uniref:Small ribosomal subunit protein bS20 n=1 Tax=Dehalogenimonas etheniformans TaxID=1536648 RepID=A0A2P5P6G2_9CHLR|nr:30S ribosomal protein S20 [Dehalogenimonas etheniformans]PPD57884.1 30S ribosomal protein S20 [Dehalogenimonas etheniformans]QNT75463.1 30S ribosomal protein S20 [Dehalogenimonas etheniformans]